MGYSVNAITEDCYDNTTCLVNKLNITDEKKLSLIEGQITFAKISELEQNPLPGNFDFEHYKAIHCFLFSDIYDWAGKIRTVNFSKKGTMFTDYNEIEKTADFCFKRLAKMKLFKNLEYNEFIIEIADFYCVTNILHPFREGNGRTQRVFISQLVRNAGYNIDFSNVDYDELLIATIQASNGVMDLLINLLKKIIT